MEVKKIVATTLAASIVASVSPANVIGESEIDGLTLDYSGEDENSDLMLMPTENIDVRKISETDTSITVSWSDFNNEKVSSYAVVCDGLESEKISYSTYTVGGLTGGCEYSIAIRAYDANGELIGVSDTIYAYTDWNITSDVTLTSNKTVADLNIGGNLNLNGYTLTVTGDAYLTSLTLFVNRGKMYVNGNFNMSSTNGNCGYGSLNVSSAEDYICVNGDFLAYSYYASTLTDGIIEVKGDFAEKKYYYGNANNFAPSGNHKVILSGEGLQTVSFERTESGFNVLELQNYSDEGIVFSTPVTINNLIDNGCNTSFANGERSGWTLEADETIEGDLFLSRGTLDLNGHKLTVTGNLVQSGGTVLANGGELEVQGDYRVQSLSGSTYGNSTGVLNMTKEADTVRVLGSFVMQSTVNHSDKLTAGTLEIGGDLTQNSGANGYNFCTSGTHTIVLNGSEKQSVSIYDNGKNYSRINNLKITNTSSEGIDFARGVYVTGKLYNTDSVIVNPTNLYISSTTVFADNAWNSNANFVENYTLSDDLSISGTVYLTGGTLQLNGHRLNVGGSFNMSSTNGNSGSGYLNMSNAEDYICVNGDFLAYSYYSNNTLTDGTIEVKGDFTQKCGYRTNNFAPSGNHKVILSGNGVQKVNFASDQSQFNILEITKSLETGYIFSRTPLWNELVEKAPNDEPPTAPANLHAERSTSTSVKIAWNASEDDSGIYCYYIYRDGKQVGSTKNLYYVDTGLESHSQHMYYVIARDVDGNMSEKSDIIEAATDADEYAPTQPANLTASVKGENTVYLSWIASSDNVKVAEYNIYRNDILIAKTEGTAYTDKNAFAGSYTYYVEAVDNEGNVSTASSKVTVDNAAPSKPVLTLGKADDSYISLEWTAADNVGVVLYGIYRNDVLVKTVAANSYVDTNVAIDSNYSYYVIAYDAAGNKSEASNEVTVYTGEDSVAPEINSIYAAKNKYSKSAPISVSAKDNRAVAAIYVQTSADSVTWSDVMTVSAGGRTAASVIGNVDLTGYSDGELYLRAYAEDASGNKSNAEDSPVFCITVDNTAPNVPYDLFASTENGALELKWDTAEADTDIEYFKIYRRIDDESDYTLAADNYRYWNYIDSNIELGTRYYYAVSAVDDVGNESELSSEAMSCISDDKITPVIHSISPVTDSKIGENPIISVSCSDNFRLGTFTAEIKQSDNEEWTEVYSKELSSYASVVEFELDTSDLADGNYDIRVKVSDSVGNISEYTTVMYNYRKCTLSSPSLTVSPIGWGAELSWSMTDTTELAGYTIYRKAPGEGSFKIIGRTVDTSFTDTDAEAGKTYYYRVDANDIRGNMIEGNIVTAVPTYEDSYEPTAVPGEGVFGIAGKAVSFDGAASYDNHYIESYHWDFGDGTTSDQAKVSHTFDSEGEHSVTLTVYDSAGNSNTAQMNVTVYPENYNCTKLKITDTNGSAISNARIYCETLPGKLDAMSDSSGCYDFVYPDGKYDVYVYQNGYLPQMITISSDENQDCTYVNLAQEDIVTGSLTSRELDFNEIKSLGIDINNPDNQNVYEYSVDLKYNLKYTKIQNQLQKIKVYINKAGSPVANIDLPAWIHSRYYCCGYGGYYTFYNCNHNQHTYVSVFHSSNSDSDNDYYYIYNQTTIRKPAVYVAIMTVEANATWMKEFYDVQLAVINNADENFSIDNASAVLNIPDGLTLADTARGDKETVNLGTIFGSTEKSAGWILRGDKAGSYDLSAKFTGTLMPFDEEIAIDFKTADPLTVNGSDALSISFRNIASSKNKWNVEFTVTNTSDKTINNVKLDFNKLSDRFLNASEILVEYPGGMIEHIFWNGGNCDENDTEEFLPALYGENEFIDSREIKPGQSIKGKFTVTGYKNNEYIY